MTEEHWIMLGITVISAIVLVAIVTEFFMRRAARRHIDVSHLQGVADALAERGETDPTVMEMYEDARKPRP